jgi:hypothetical protein
MEITEKDLEDLIFDDLVETGGSDLIDRGFNTGLISREHFQNRVHWHRQVSFGAYGIADLVGYTRQNGSIYIDIVELKNVPLKCGDFDQLLRYKTAALEVAENTFKGDFACHVSTYLVGPSIDAGHYIHNQIRFALNLYTFKFSIAGFQFEHHSAGWHRSDAKGLSLADVRSARRCELNVPDGQEEKNGKEIH